MQKYTIGLTGVLLMLLLFNGCMADDELSAPVNVNLHLEMGSNTPGISYVDFHNIAIAVRQIKFYGIREVGSDIFFNSQPNAPYGIYVIRKDQSPPLINAFDIPQGVYNQMRWEIQTREIDDDYYEDYFDEELDEYIDIDDFGIIIEGKYTRHNGSEILLFIAIDPEEILLMETYDSGGNNQLSLLAGKTYRVRLELNPYIAIQNIERSLLENAETDEENDVEYIEISSDENEDLYERILFRMKNTVKAIIEEQ